MTLTNLQIYNAANTLAEQLKHVEQSFPVKVTFYLLKNKMTLLQLAQEIDQSREAILQKYGTYDEEHSQYNIAPEQVAIANEELVALFSLEQDVKIYPISLSSFKETDSLSPAQMEAIMFMIED